jgi:hypothetical protein
MLKIMNLLGQILDHPNYDRVAFEEWLITHRNDLDGQEGFNADEIALFEQYARAEANATSKIKAIKANRERTGRSLTEVVQASKRLFESKSWNW